LSAVDTSVLRYLEELTADPAQTQRWNRPKLNRDLMITVQYRAAARRDLVAREG